MDSSVWYWSPTRPLNYLNQQDFDGHPAAFFADSQTSNIKHKPAWSSMKIQLFPAGRFFQSNNVECRSNLTSAGGMFRVGSNFHSIKHNALGQSPYFRLVCAAPLLQWMLCHLHLCVHNWFASSVWNRLQERPQETSLVSFCKQCKESVKNCGYPAKVSSHSLHFSPQNSVLWMPALHRYSL